MVSHITQNEINTRGDSVVVSGLDKPTGLGFLGLVRLCPGRRQERGGLRHQGGIRGRQALVDSGLLATVVSLRGKFLPHVLSQPASHLLLRNICFLVFLLHCSFVSSHHCLYLSVHSFESEPSKDQIFNGYIGRLTNNSTSTSAHSWRNLAVKKLTSDLLFILLLCLFPSPFHELHVQQVP